MAETVQSCLNDRLRDRGLAYSSYQICSKLQRKQVDITLRPALGEIAMQGPAMNLDRESRSIRSATSSADFSSPALPELSLDASLQRFHQEEDVSVSFISSAARSRAWLRESQQHEIQHQSSWPQELSPHYHPTEPVSTEHHPSFCFPPLLPSQPITSSKERLGATPPGDPALQAPPRTSRGPSHPKPFLSSSSRATSIASIAEVEQQDKQDARPRILFGTPFAGSAFERRIDDYPSDRQVGQRRSDSSASGLSPKQSYASLPVHRQEFQPNSSQSPVQSRRPHASSLQFYKPQPSQWSILLAPLSNNNNSSTNAEAQAHDETILLPLQRSIEDQIECLKAHLSTSPNFNAKCRSDSDVDFYLDLSSVSALPASTMARLTLQSWKIAFDRYFKGGATFDKHRDVSLPYLFRQTGLPIVALIRYFLTPPLNSLRPSPSLFSKSHTAVSTFKSASAARSGIDTHDSSPWTRRKSEMTVSRANTGRLGISSSMVQSKSFPGAPRTPVRKSPLSYSPQTRSFPRDNVRPLISAALTLTASPTTQSQSHQQIGYRGGEDNKLRSLSLATAHPLSATEPVSTKQIQAAGGLAFGSDLQESIVSNPEEEHEAPSLRQRYQSSRGSSHRSFPSHTTSLSTHPTQPTSIHSSRSQLRPPSQHVESDGDADTEDVGSRFWTQLSSLGKQVSREKTAPGLEGFGRAGNVSASSTASSASVFDFSPLGIFVPTEAEEPSREIQQDTGSVNVSPTSLTLPTGTSTGLLGRRRAYSSMVPLTGWRAGDNDISTAENSALDLPQVLLLHARESSGPSELNVFDSMDLVTPTVSTFQGRARAQSFQPSISFQPRLDATLALGGLARPLPGLFYENWAERVDIGIDGDLGRRGSTVLLDGGEVEVPPTAAGPIQPGPTSTLTRTSSTLSGSTILGSAGSVSSLQIMHESKWPLPQSRSVVADDISHSTFAVISSGNPNVESTDASDAGQRHNHAEEAHEGFSLPTNEKKRPLGAWADTFPRRASSADFRAAGR
ncbi:uncharacterized protein UHO2_06215 [Ustilago hordei]|uniref:uncharacterized protein n=1 Tax=Ustilago hordei TaxID=120017 RepID=UPI001A591756|nr:uncharacterized protein UHO2_06215 [Ustilago hordei]SYW86998.1 uncharacterized protein UHO2_06215 [Ustilago hordei]